MRAACWSLLAEVLSLALRVVYKILDTIFSKEKENLDTIMLAAL